MWSLNSFKSVTDAKIEPIKVKFLTLRVWGTHYRTRAMQGGGWAWFFFGEKMGWGGGIEKEVGLRKLEWVGRKEGRDLEKVGRG